MSESSVMEKRCSTSKVPLPKDRIFLVESPNSDEFRLFCWAIRRSVVVGMDTEWRPAFMSKDAGMPRVSLFQIACRVYDFDNEHISDEAPDSVDDTAWRSRIFGDSSKLQDVIFLLDLLVLPAASLSEILKDLLASKDILKLGFNWKQDLWYLAGSFPGQEEDLHGCFDVVSPYLDIKKVYSCLQNKELLFSHKERAYSVQEINNKSLSGICEEILGIHLSKDFQCSDWEQRPLSEEQLAYASADAHCLLCIFDVFEKEFVNFLQTGQVGSDTGFINPVVGLREILTIVESNGNNHTLKRRVGCAVEIVKATVEVSELLTSVGSTPNAKHRREESLSLLKSILNLSNVFGERILLSQCKIKAKSGNRKGKYRYPCTGDDHKARKPIEKDEWQGPPPWDISLGGDGIPKFLCDVMVEGLARQLRCVGIDAACPSVKKAEPRRLAEQAERERRVLLTRDIKLLRRHLVEANLAYRVKNLSKRDQLVEVIKVFNLRISEDKLMSRCIKCNGTFLEKTLTVDEAMEVAVPKQMIPEFLQQRNLEFWQCSDCHQLYWEGTQYHNAIQQFSGICMDLKEGSY